MVESLLLLLRLLKRSPQGTMAITPLPVRVSAGTASPVPDAPGGPPAPPPLSQHLQATGGTQSLPMALSPPPLPRPGFSLLPPTPKLGQL